MFSKIYKSNFKTSVCKCENCVKESVLENVKKYININKYKNKTNNYNYFYMKMKMKNV
jgi:hypothetical protein